MEHKKGTGDTSGMEEKTSGNAVEGATGSALAPERARKHWADRVAIRIINRLPGSQVSRGVRSPHFWTIVALMAVLTLVYYAGHTPLARLGGFFTDAFLHDLHRTLFLLPIIYAALTFRVRGALVTSFAFLCVVLPRAFYSPYADPLIRPLLFVLFTAFVGVLTAVLMDRIDEEREIIRRLKETREQLVHAEKLASLGQLSASIAHEINNPLAGVLTYTKLLAKKISGDTLEKGAALDYLSKMESEVGRCSRIIRNLLDFSRQSEPRFKLIDSNQVLEQVLAMVGHQAQLQNVDVVRELSPSLPKVMADFDQLQQVFMNLTLNAIQAMSGGGKLTLRTSVANSKVRIDVQDTGCGISKENMSKLFTPFFTTKEKGSGVGLGLAVVRGIIERHKGEIKVQSEVGKGTTFSVYLGVHDDEKTGV
jgi:signal transduction histidine kinase